MLGWGSGSVDRIAIKAFLGDEQLGIYSFIFQLVQIFKLGAESFLKSINVLIYKNLDLIKLFLQSRKILIIALYFFAFLYFIFIIFLYKYDLFLNYPIPISLFLILIFSRVILLSNFMEVIFFYAEVDSRSVSYSNLISFLFLISIIMPCIMIAGLEGVALSLFLYALLNYIILNFFRRTDIAILLLNVLLLILPFVFLLLLKYV
tara:strand:- start:23 stop:637 length:615 start_codon:yes stop_codon:yes gene_type:complete